MLDGICWSLYCWVVGILECCESKTEVEKIEHVLVEGLQKMVILLFRYWRAILVNDRGCNS